MLDEKSPKYLIKVRTTAVTTYGCSKIVLEFPGELLPTKIVVRVPVYPSGVSDVRYLEVVAVAKGRGDTPRDEPLSI